MLEPKEVFIEATIDASDFESTSRSPFLGEPCFQKSVSATLHENGSPPVFALYLPIILQKELHVLRTRIWQQSQRPQICLSQIAETYEPEACRQENLTEEWCFTIVKYGSIPGRPER